jgi:hypothetical protein
MALRRARLHFKAMKKRKVTPEQFAADALDQMGCEALEALLRVTPETSDDAALREAC